MEWISVQQYAIRKNVSVRTVYRLIDKNEIQHERVGKQWRIAVSDRDSLDVSDQQVHQEYVLGIFIGIRMELTPFSTSFPEVRHLSYRTGSASRLKCVPTGSTNKIEWQLGEEQKYGWQFTFQHLQSGLPNALKALREFKESYASYCQLLGEQHDRYLDDAQESLNTTRGGVRLNLSTFFRSILREADKESSTPNDKEYPITPVPGEVEVSFEGEVLFWAADEREGQEWVSRHQGWRREFRNRYKDRLDQLRRDMRAGADILVKTINEVEVGGRVPGTCDKCPQRVRERA